MTALEKYLYQLRRIEKHRAAAAEKEIRKIYKDMLKELNGFLGNIYATYSEDDKLDYAMLAKAGMDARFLEEVEQRINGISPQVAKQIQETVEQTYEACYDGMRNAVVKAAGNRELLQQAFASVTAVSPDVIKQMVNNPISGLTLKDTLEKHRKDIIYDIKKNIGVGLTNGDRFSTMAKRIAESVDGDYNKAIRIVRTETHRVRESGFNDAATEINTALKNGSSGYVMAKTWRTMQDERVRPARAKGKARKYNHEKMDGVTIPQDELFELPSGATCKAPSQTGVAGEDINCRCYLSYNLVLASELTPQDGKQAKQLPEVTPQKDFNTPFTPDEEQALESYVSGDGMYINNYLRGRGEYANGLKLQDDEKEFLKDLESATDRVLDSKTTKLYRSVDASAVFGDLSYDEYEALTSTLIYGLDDKYYTQRATPIIKNAKGKTITDNGFMSTTKSRELADEWGGFTGSDKPIVIEFDVPKGTKGADLAKWDIEGDEQFEVLLKNKTKYEITDIVGENGNICVKARIIPEKTTTAKVTTKTTKAKVEAKNMPAQFTATKAEAKNTQQWLDYINNVEGADENVLAMFNGMGKYGDAATIPMKISHGKNHAVQTRSYSFTGQIADVKVVIPKISGDVIHGQVQTMTHELTHYIDLLNRTDLKKSGGWFSASSTKLRKAFFDTTDEIGDEIKELFAAHKKEHEAIRKAVNAKRDAAIEELKKEYGGDIWSLPYTEYKAFDKKRKKIATDAEDERDYLSRNIMGGGVNNLQDIYDALSGGIYRDNGTVTYGHGYKYYASKDNRIEETLANYSALSVTRPDLIKMLKKDKPDMCKALDELIAEIVKGAK